MLQIPWRATPSATMGLNWSSGNTLDCRPPGFAIAPRSDRGPFSGAGLSIQLFQEVLGQFNHTRNIIASKSSISFQIRNRHSLDNTGSKDKYLQHFPWNCLQLDITRPHCWYVHIGSCYGLVPLAITWTNADQIQWRQIASLDQNEFNKLRLT